MVMLIMPKCYIYGTGVKVLKNSAKSGRLWLSHNQRGYYLFFGDVVMMPFGRGEKTSGDVFNGAWE